jgi:hypothetical protein
MSLELRSGLWFGQEMKLLTLEFLFASFLLQPEGEGLW